MVFAEYDLRCASSGPGGCSSFGLWRLYNLDSQKRSGSEFGRSKLWGRTRRTHSDSNCDRVEPGGDKRQHFTRRNQRPQFPAHRRNPVRSSGSRREYQLAAAVYSSIIRREYRSRHSSQRSTRDSAQNFSAWHGGTARAKRFARITGFS